MPVFDTREVRPFSQPRRVVTSAGQILAVPDDWALLPPGDAALSRRLKAGGPSWTVIELKGNKRFSRGIWAPAARIDALRSALALERTDPSYQKKLDAGRRRRAAEEVAYVGDFRTAVLAFLSFHPRYALAAAELADRITRHATPVGSGTVARTERIPLPDRAEAATIAWLRHQTTGYDSMTIARVKGRRREVRRELAQRSQQLLQRYRLGQPVEAACPLQVALRTLGRPAPAAPSSAARPPAPATSAEAPSAASALSPDEQHARFAQSLQESDWGHQPC